MFLFDEMVVRQWNISFNCHSLNFNVKSLSNTFIINEANQKDNLGLKINKSLVFTATVIKKSYFDKRIFFYFKH